MSLDTWIAFLSLESLWWTFGLFFAVSLVEMWFPPFPGDAVYFVALVSMSASGVSVAGALFAAWLGGSIGFATLYWLGRARGRKFFERRPTGLRSIETLQRFQRWFTRWGGWVIVLGRFLAGVRSAVPLAAGAVEYPQTRTLVLGAVSVVIWNGLLASVALVLGQNWDTVSSVLRTYSLVLWIGGLLGVIVWVVYKQLMGRRRTNG